MSSYEDNRIGLDDQNEYQQILPLVQVQPNKRSNLDEIFKIIMNKAETKKNNHANNNESLTQDDLCKLDSFGTALTW